MAPTLEIYIVLLASIFATSSPALAACSKTLIFANSDWVPSVSSDKTPVPPQLDEVILARIMEIPGCTIQNRFVPFTRLLQEIERGFIGGTTSASSTKERSMYANFSTHTGRKKLSCLCAARK